MDISLQMLRIFCRVVEDNSFSGAARSLKVTQPTVSQQIARLESEVGGKVFERVGHVIHLTDLGREVHKMAQEILEKTSDFSERLRDQKMNPSGTVRYAMPESCQWTPHYRKIMNGIREFPAIQFEIDILHNEQILNKLLKAEIDFGFVMGEKIHPELRFEKFSDERYSMVAADRSLFQPIKQKKFSELRIISYPGWEEFLMIWAKAHGLRKELSQRLSKPTVTIGTLAGAIHAAQEGAGVVVIPSHCVESQGKTPLFFYNENDGKEPSQPIYIAKRLNEKLPRRAEIVLDMLKAAKTLVG